MSTFSEEDLNKSFRGVVSKWFPGRHFGFIVADNGQEVFLGKHEWPESIDPKLNTVVEFSLGKNGKGWAALKCAIESTPAIEVPIISKAKKTDKKLKLKLESLKKVLKSDEKEEEKKLPAVKDDSMRYGPLLPKSMGTRFYNSEDLSTIMQALDFFRAMESWTSASGFVSACRDMSVIFVSQMEDYKRSLYQNMFSGLSVSSTETARAKDLWEVIVSSCRTFDAVAEVLCESNSSRLGKVDELMCSCFESCVNGHVDMIWISKASWVLLHAARSQSLCPDNFLNAFLLVNWYLVEVASLPFPLAFNFETMSEEVNDQLREALTSDDEIFLAQWISKELARQWVEFDCLVQQSLAENSVFRSESVGTLKAAAFAASETANEVQQETAAADDANNPSTSTVSARDEEERAHEIVVNHRRTQRADQCFICMDDNIRPTISLLCCGQPCHIKCMEKWYASKPNLVGREKCPQCTQEIPEPMLATAAAPPTGPPSAHPGQPTVAGHHVHPHMAPAAVMYPMAPHRIPDEWELLHARSRSAARATAAAMNHVGSTSSGSHRAVVSHIHGQPVVIPQSTSSGIPGSMYFLPPPGYQPYAPGSSSSSNPTGYPPATSGTSSGSSRSQRFRTVMVPLNEYYSTGVVNGGHHQYTSGHPAPSAMPPSVVAGPGPSPMYYSSSSHHSSSTAASSSRSASGAPVGSYPLYVPASASYSYSPWTVPSVNPPSPPRSPPNADDLFFNPSATAVAAPAPAPAPAVMPTPSASSSSSSRSTLPSLRQQLLSAHARPAAPMSSSPTEDRNLLTQFSDFMIRRVSPPASRPSRAAPVAVAAPAPEAELTVPVVPSAPPSEPRTTNVTVIPMNARSEELLRPLRSGEAPAIQPSLHAVPQSPLCQHCGVALRAIECTNFHCGRCCQRVGALNCLRHHVTQVTPAGALVLTDDASPTPPGEVRSVDDNANDSNDESAEDIYDLRPDPELTAMTPRNTTLLQEQPASSLLFAPAAAARTPAAGDGEYFQFPSLDSHDDNENDNENETTAVAGVVAFANPEVTLRNDNDDAEERTVEEEASTAAE